MELSSLRCFLCVARNLSFSRAAEQLYISQSTLSYHISNLERELNSPLFIRDKRKLILTDAGKILLEEVTKAFIHLDTAIQRISDLAANNSTIRFGFLELLITPCFNLFVSPFLAKNPELHSLLERSGYSLLEELIENRYDFIFTRKCMINLQKDKNGLCHRTLIKDSFSIAVPVNHPCARFDSISDLSQLNGSKLLIVDKYISGNVYDTFLKSILQAHGFKTTSSGYVVHNMDELLTHVASGSGISILPFYTSINLPYRGVKLLRLERQNNSGANVVLVWKNNHMIPLKQKYLNFLDTAFPEPIKINPLDYFQVRDYN